MSTAWQQAVPQLNLQSIAELATGAQYNRQTGQPGRLVWLRRGHRAAVFELDAATEGRAAHKLIGKVYSDASGRHAFEVQSQLWKAGLRPPGRLTVARPLAYVTGLDLFLQEKAPGHTLWDMLFGEIPLSAEAVVGIGSWLAALHATTLPLTPRVDALKTALLRRGSELAAFLPEHARRVNRLVATAFEKLSPHRLTSLVPSHGDFHPKNVYVAASGRVTAIDLDTIGLQERAADVASLLAQTATMGYFRKGSLQATCRARNALLRAYELAALPLPQERLALYLGMEFLHNLHYQLVAMRTGHFAIVEPWLRTAERCLLDAEVNGIVEFAHEQ